MSVEARHWRLRQQRYRLVGEICPHCQTAIFPPRDICLDCGQETTPDSQVEFSGKGEVYSYSVVNHDKAPPKFKEQAPYVIALIKLQEGPIVTAQLTDLDYHWENGRKIYDNLEISMPVEMATRRLKVEGDDARGLLVYGYKFRPLLKRS